MAAYAAVTSLMGTIHLISQSDLLHLEENNKKHLESLYEKVSSVLEFLDNSDDEPMKDLQEKVEDLANEVEHEVESQVLLVKEKDEQVRTEANERLLKILRQAIQDMDSVKKEFIKLQRRNNSLLAGNRSLSPRLHVSTLEKDMVGHSNERKRMLDLLTGRSSQPQVISIVGMGGIGKSTFAKNMFSDSSIVGFFDVRGWITVSEDYSIRKMLLSLLQEAIGVNEELNKKDDGELADCLQKSLKRRRYLIVVDDIWSSDAWDNIRLWFPENSNRSRILLTTRDINVAQYASSHEGLFPMPFLEPKESWNLFCQKAFGKKDCPAEFESVGKVVVENCKGLPLMISVVAGSLSRKRTLHEWYEVAQSVSSLVDVDDYQRCSGVLALSYKHLPSHLKACFLYFGVFKKASEISVEKLIQLWMAEGLFELRGLGEWEKVAANLLHDLIDKSLIVVSKHSLDGNIKTCRIHDLLHDLCLIEAERENLLYVPNPSISEPKSVIQDRRWVSFHLEEGCFFSSLTYSKTRSVKFLSGKIRSSTIELGLNHFKLLRVLDLGHLITGSFPKELSYLVSLRYLAMGHLNSGQYLPVYKLQNLQTFIIRRTKCSAPCWYHLPNGTWKMSQLRHLHFESFYLCSPPKLSADEVKYQVLDNLQSIYGLSPDCCTKQMFEGIKKVKKLGICGTTDDFCREPKSLDNIIYLPELEALKIVVYDSHNRKLPVPCPDSFPPNLKKLTLQGAYQPWKAMTIISKLPKLEVLKLKVNYSFGWEHVGENVWEVAEEGFPKLKFLLLENRDLKYWKSTDDSFPLLETIIIRKCRSLQEIPQAFADSMTLQRIELRGCTPSLVEVAKKIQNDQEEELGNNILKVDAFDTIN
ncbi:putative late blight resistance protein homolog R1A-10 [Lycium barbarum]|uniref:putative late blight resistance protein homolog R1A-10 n=1 Tax=Lycium barbarum TaxID=112863 RepID=UPI00293EA17A|nr:putative late blight resistance protein homolog R1A-10 [Lycium barbarum]XP_060179699.1 putative late blight resistance protein homolog R1A-10 [Lycium barbarum]